MKHIVLGCAFAVAAATAAQAQVTKEDLRKVVGAGLSDDLIVTWVKAMGGPPKLTADDLIEFKRAGATDSLLAGVLAAVPEPRPKVVARPVENENRPPPGRYRGAIDLGGLPYTSFPADPVYCCFTSFRSQRAP